MRTFRSASTSPSRRSRSRAKTPAGWPVELSRKAMSGDAASGWELVVSNPPYVYRSTACSGAPPRAGTRAARDRLHESIARTARTRFLVARSRRRTSSTSSRQTRCLGLFDVTITPTSRESTAWSRDTMNDAVQGHCGRETGDPADRHGLRPCVRPPPAPSLPSRLYKLKGRDPLQPTALLASGLDVLFECVPGCSPCELIARTLLPGPVHVVLPKPCAALPL